MRIAMLCCLLAGLHHGSGVAIADGTLDSMRQEVEEPNQEKPDKPRRPPRVGFSVTSSDCDDDTDDEPSTAAFKFVTIVATSPWWGPHVALEGEESGAAEFPPAPYTTHEGFLSFDSDQKDTDSWSGRLSIDRSSNFDDISSLSGRLRIDTSTRFGLDSEWVRLHEDRPGPDDTLSRGDLNLVVRFAQSERAQFHSGIGMNWLTGSGDPDFGFNFTYGADFFPIDPVVVSTTFDLGNVGNATLTHFRSTIGVMTLKRFHVYTGYDYLNIEGNSIHSLLSGIEFWF